jgi:hypothetical protein
VSESCVNVAPFTSIWYNQLETALKMYKTHTQILLPSMLFAVVFIEPRNEKWKPSNLGILPPLGRRAPERHIYGAPTNWLKLDARHSGNRESAIPSSTSQHDCDCLGCIKSA